MAWKFDDTVENYVLVDDNAALTLPAGDWTLAGWIKSTSIDGSGFQYFFSWGFPSSSNSINITLLEASGGTPNGIKIIIHDGATVNDHTFAATPGLNREWQHFAFVRSSDALRLYLNGVVDENVLDLTGFGDVNNSDPLYLGIREDLSDTRRFDGCMSDWAKWDRALTETELLLLSDNTRPSAITEDLAWYIKMTVDDYTEEIVPLTVTNYGSTECPSGPYPRNASKWNALDWDVRAGIVEEILIADEHRDGYVVQLHAGGGGPVFLAFGVDAEDGVGTQLLYAGSSIRVSGEKARLSMSAISAADASGGIEANGVVHYSHKKYSRAAP